MIKIIIQYKRKLSEGKFATKFAIRELWKGVKWLCLQKGEKNGIAKKRESNKRKRTKLSNKDYGR